MLRSRATFRASGSSIARTAYPLKMPQAKRDMSRAQTLRLIGFTLAEILVALALIALLAAVLLPTVAGQILKGDAARVQQDLEAVRAGIDQFLADVHRYPGKYSDLSTKITTTTSTHTDINAAGYPAGLVSKWAGPYITKDTVNAVIETGFGGTIQNGFGKSLNTNGINYVTIRIHGIAPADYDKIDQAIDGTSTACPACRNNGLMRLVTAAGFDTTKFLAVPIQ
jgi:prepilin-type N-terminal cleavage/methylation domain-containing protein